MALIVFTGDSHTDGTGAGPGQSWPAQLERMLGIADLTVVNLARAGAPLAEQIAAWDGAVAPHLAQAQGVRVVFAMGGYNDIHAARADAGAILATYRLAATRAREAGARFVCGLDVIRKDFADGAVNAIVRSVNETLRADPDGLFETRIDFAAVEPFDRPVGPYPRPPFASDEVHLDDEGQRRMAEIALPLFRSLLGGGAEGA